MAKGFRYIQKTTLSAYIKKNSGAVGSVVADDAIFDRDIVAAEVSARWNFTKTAFAVAGNNNMVALTSIIGNRISTDPVTGWTLATNGREWESYYGSFQALNNGEGGSSAGSPTYTTFSADELQGGFIQAGHSVANISKYPLEFINLPAGTYKLYLIASIKSSINSDVPNCVFKVKFGSAVEQSQTILQAANYTTPALLFTGSIQEGEKIEFGPYTLTEIDSNANILNALLIERVDGVNLPLLTNTSTLFPPAVGFYTPDTDALAYLQENSITSQQLIDATNALVKMLKEFGIYTKGQLINPVLGGTWAQHVVNLKDPRDLEEAFRLILEGGWTHSATGMTPNGTNAYGNTFWNPAIRIPSGFMSLGIYLRTDIEGTTCDIGVSNQAETQQSAIWSRFGGIFYGLASTTGIVSNAPNNDSRGWFFASRSASTTNYLQKDVTQENNTEATGVPNGNIFVGARHRTPAGTAEFFSPREIAFIWIGESLTNAEGLNLQKAVQTFQTAAGGRQIGAPALYLIEPFVNQSVLFAPEVSIGSGALNLTLPLLTNTSVLYAPTVVPGAVEVVAPLITNTSTLYAPTVVQVQTVSLPLLTNTSSLFEPSISVGAVTLTVPLLTNTSVLYAPSVTPGAVTVTLPLLTNTSVLYAPTVSPQPVTVTLPLLTNTSTLYPPTIVDEAAVILPLLTNTSVLYAPTVTPGSVVVELPLLTNTSTLYAPEVVIEYLLELPYLVNNNVLYAPTVVPQAVTVTLPLLSNSNTLYPPEVALNTATDLFLPFISSTSVLFEPTVAPGPVTVTVPLIPSIAELYSPEILPGMVALDLPTLINSNSLFVPEIFRKRLYVQRSGQRVSGTMQVANSGVYTGVAYFYESGQWHKL